ncbi:outer membrane protein assembly factor BamE domain-containing protein [Zobellia alginiliquefaciens]|uniref:outer membrane protein assembly factor BamE domain-containing protein n=1 Tax=Zobellia alginiliquefaciens TaxID=3032586 RepID=UPI0023E3D4EF|nr:outer membrane protein assembly factor BamE [Zobellia alginiliquefaciens]
MQKYLPLLILTIFLSSCGINKKHLKQNLSTSYQLSPGMSKAEVEKIMGQPAKSDFSKNVEEWHYCKTGMGSDEFIALFFYEGNLIEKLNYTVTLADARGATGSCEKFIKMGNYREPSQVLEIRMR